MPEYWVGILDYEPESSARWRRGLIEDGESRTGLWISADSPGQAIAWGERVGEILHRLIDGNPTIVWSDAGCSSRLVDSPKASGRAHCLDVFQRVRVGEMPALEHMTTGAYCRRVERRA